VPRSPNRCVFSNSLNSPRLSHCRILEGNEFHRRGPAVVNHWLPKVLCGRWTAYIAVSVEQSRRMLISAIQSSARSISALHLPDRHWKTRTAIMNWTCCHMGNQCSYGRIRVMWLLVTSHAAFWMDCTQCSSPSDMPNSSALQ